MASVTMSESSCYLYIQGHRALLNECLYIKGFSTVEDIREKFFPRKETSKSLLSLSHIQHIVSSPAFLKIIFLMCLYAFYCPLVLLGDDSIVLKKSLLIL